MRFKFVCWRRLKHTKKISSRTGNRTRVSSVTARDTNHYTIRDHILSLVTWDQFECAQKTFTVLILCNPSPYNFITRWRCSSSKLTTTEEKAWADDDNDNDYDYDGKMMRQKLLVASLLTLQQYNTLPFPSCSPTLNAWAKLDMLKVFADGGSETIATSLEQCSSGELEASRVLTKQSVNHVSD